MSLSDRIAKAVISFATGRAISYIKKDPERDLSKTVRRVLAPFRRIFPQKKVEGIIRGAGDTPTAR